MLFWVTCSFFGSTVVRPERKKWNTYSFTELWTIGVLYFFALFFGILLVTSVILHVVMSPVHLDFFTTEHPTSYRKKLVHVVMSAVHLDFFKAEHPTFYRKLAGGTPPRTPPWLGSVNWIRIIYWCVVVTFCQIFLIWWKRNILRLIGFTSSIEGWWHEMRVFVS